VIEIRAYIDERGRNRFDRCFQDLDPRSAARVNTALTRLAAGNVSNVKGVGRGVHEYRIDYGPGLRLYFGRDGNSLVILLCGGTKRRQQRDIEAATALWREYRRRKRREP